jgi:integrase/recombinase XerD
VVLRSGIIGPTSEVYERNGNAFLIKLAPAYGGRQSIIMQPCQTHEEKLVIWTLLDAGLRVAELASLTKDNLDWQNHRLMIYGKGGPYGKLSKRRIIPLSSRIQPLLEGHLGLHDRMQIGVRTIQRMVKQVANRAHIRRKVSPHVLRHTFSVTCIQKGISTRALQEILGHDRLATTEIYLNLSPEDVIREFHSKW